MGVLTAALFMVAVPPKSVSGLWLVTLAAYLLLAGMPSWLYLRFLTVKLTSVYMEYVLNLHRLGVDEPEHLPQPPHWSEYWPVWARARADYLQNNPTPGQSLSMPDESVYDTKFEAYFGRREGQAEFFGMGSLLPVITVWLAFAIGWLTIFSEPAFYTGDLTLGDALRFGFMGAYLFTLQLTVRAFFQNDLRSGTYVSVLERLAVVLVLVTVIHTAWVSLLGDTASGIQAVVAFVVGSFPLVGQEWLNQVAAARMGRRVGSLNSRHPLSDLDGMNVWYEARLLEEGIQDVQNLATANVVDIVLHSRAPVGRIVDWIDQALLLQHLPAKTLADDRSRSRDRVDQLLLHTCESLGIRTATDLLELYAPLSPAAAGELPRDLHPLEPAQPPGTPFYAWATEFLSESDRSVIDRRLLATLRCLGSEPNLRLVLNWQTGHGPECTALADNSRPAAADVRSASPRQGSRRPVRPRVHAWSRRASSSRPLTRA